MRTTDPRWIRSRTRLRAAVLRLAARGPVSRISMGEVAAEADVSRSTAYLHAGSARELLEDALRAELDEVRERMRGRLREDGDRALASACEVATREMVAHVERRAEVYRAGMTGTDGLRDLLREHFAGSVLALLRESAAGPGAIAGAAPELVEELVSCGIAAAGTAQIEVWVAQPAPRDPEVLVAVTGRLLPAWWPAPEADPAP